MEIYYSIDWKKVPLDEFPGKKTSSDPNVFAVRVTCLDRRGDVRRFVHLYRDWLGVCTDDIESVVREMKTYLPGLTVRYERLLPDGKLHQKVLPYFPERLKSDRLDPELAPFYKVYVEDCCAVEDVGEFFRRYEIGYHRKEDWLVRLYIDLQARAPPKSDDAGFFYKWYAVDPSSPWLPDAFRRVRNAAVPNWKIAAFDLETVPPLDDDYEDPNRVPDGTDPGDRIVMISLVIWDHDSHDPPEEKVLYLNPLSSSDNNKLRLENPNYLEYQSESDLLNDFHYFVGKCRVLTGYNVLHFDLPCLLARLLFLQRYDLLSRYSSRIVGESKILTFDDKIVLDLYPYFRVFSNYDLDSFKLDRVAETKLGDRKIAVDSTGIHAWYRYLSQQQQQQQQQSTTEDALALCRSRDVAFCHRMISPTAAAHLTVDRFGTFPQYVEYCLRDSQLVRKLFLKETVLSFLTARSDFAALDVVQSMHYGNSRFLFEVFRAYGTASGFFVNLDHFENRTDFSVGETKRKKDRSGGTTYQGALNYCLPETHFEDVAVLDFASMYPASLLSSNLCYGTCDILSTEDYLKLDERHRRRLDAVPYRTHSDADFVDPRHEVYHHRCLLPDDEYEFRYPAYDPVRDSHVIVVDRRQRAFLPSLVGHFLELRRHHQSEWKRTRNVVHYNSQLCVKLLVNSLYGTMASRESPLGYVVVAMAIVTLARYQLLGCYHYVQDVLGRRVCYADTDSLMVHRWPPGDECEALNRFLGRTLPHVEIKFERRMRRLLVLSKKRYVYVGEEGVVATKGFQKKVNGIVRFMSDAVVNRVMALRGTRGDPSDGWIAWVDILKEALYMCRDPRRYSVTRKTRKLADYVSTTCTAVKMLKKYPDRIEEGDYVDFAFSRADVAEDRVSDWVMDAEDCRYVNFEKLFVNQKKILYTVLNVGYWNAKDPRKACDAVLNTIRWRYFVHAELLHFLKKQRRKVVMLMERGVRYSFRVNDHLFAPKKKDDAKKRKKRRVEKKNI